ncbi:MAG: Uracil-DNA glycosylase [Candidatus Taylorbacteria bacterium]|nr:Uracil-DNA glycosylase [Candidatus Taylorbacteria bacterium]
MNIRIEPSWKEALKEEFGKEYFKQLTEFVKREYLSTTVYPPPKFVFNAFELCPFDKVEVVILGQDPYHGAGQAHGLSFSVPEGQRIPPSLQNIYKEIKNDLGAAAGSAAGTNSEIPKSGNLEHWAKQGVLLLNATLTVRASTPGSHQHQGWEAFTDAVIRTISDKKEHVVFILWGRYAREKAALIDGSKHLILESAHPSPFSATHFFGNHHFSQTNAYLEKHGKQAIKWI